MSNFLAFTVIGLCTAGAYAIAASGLVLTYTTSGIFNFAHGAIGMLMAFTYWELSVHQGWPEPLALAVVLLVIAPAAGLAIERVLMRSLARADPGTKIVVTLGLLVLMIGVANAIWPYKSRYVPQFFNGHTVQLLGVRVTYHKLLTFGLAALVALLLRVLLYRTRIGVAMRGVVDDRELAAMNGLRPARVSQLSWALSSSLAGLAGILLAPDLSLNVVNLTFVVVTAYAAAAVGRLRSLPLTFVGAMILGLADAYAQSYLTKFKFLANVRPTMPAFLLLGVLLLLPAVRLRAGRATGARAPRVPRRTEALTGALGLVLLSIVVSRLVTGAINLQALNTGMATALIMLSLVILTGYGGQVSLAQFAFVGIGAVVFDHLGHSGSPVALLACAAICGSVGAIVALPALRLDGLYLALSTMAFALLADQLFFANSHVFGGAGASTTIHRLSIPGVSLASNHSNLVMLTVVFALFGVGVLALRRGQFGRTLTAMSDSPAACATLGLDLTLTKLSAFGLSAAMAGVAGALYGGTQGIVGGNDFYYVQSLVLILMAYVGGIDTVTGALVGGLLLGAVYPIVSPHLPHALQQLSYIGTGLGAITIARNRSGIVGQVTATVDRLRRRPVFAGSPITEGGPIAAPLG